MALSIGFIGAGNMAGAIIQGILSQNTDYNVYAYDIDYTKSSRFGKAVKAVDDPNDLLQVSDYIFIAVKPQIVETVLDGLKAGGFDLGNKVFITLVAGMSTDFVCEKLNNRQLHVIRIMPNTPMMLGHGSTSICCNLCTTPAELSFVQDLLSGAGYVCAISEDKMNAAISINGSSPAYMFVFAQAVIDYAKDQGIDEKDALALFANTMIGSAHMLLESQMSPSELIKMVTSPGGTTLEALHVFNDQKFSQIIYQAMAACTRRAEELGR